MEETTQSSVNTENSPAEELGMFIRHIREARNTSSTLLASMSGVRRSFVRRLEEGQVNGRSRDAILRVIGSISRWLTAKQRKEVFSLVSSISKDFSKMSKRRKKWVVFPKKRPSDRRITNRSF